MNFTLGELINLKEKLEDRTILLTLQKIHPPELKTLVETEIQKLASLLKTLKPLALMTAKEKLALDLDKLTTEV